MKIKTLYRYTRVDGGTSVSPNKPEGQCTELKRIFADPGKVLTKDGKDFYSVIDDNSTEGWYEVEAPQEETE